MHNSTVRPKDIEVIEPQLQAASEQGLAVRVQRLSPLEIEVYHIYQPASRNTYLLCCPGSLVSRDRQFLRDLHYMRRILIPLATL